MLLNSGTGADVNRLSKQDRYRYLLHLLLKAYKVSKYSKKQATQLGLKLERDISSKFQRNHSGSGQKFSFLSGLKIMAYSTLIQTTSKFKASAK
jgi:hypothetical protein